MAITSSNDIYLDFTSKDMVTIQCCQYDDKSRTYIIHLMDKGKEITLDNNKHQLVFKQDKKDGTSIFNECTIKSDGTAEYTLTEQSCVFAGIHDIQFMLYDIESNEVINTMPAKLNVTKSVADNVKIESSNDYNKLNHLLLESKGHINNLSNPHGVTKEQIGLGNADNTSDIDKPVSKAQQAAIDDAVKNYLPLSGGEISDDENTLEIYPNRIIGSSDSFISGFDEIHANLFEGDLNGNATTAKRLETERTIELTGSVTGNGTFDGSGDLIIETTTNHTHDYVPLSGGEITGDLNVTGEIDTPDIHTNELYLDNAGGSVFYLDEYGFRPMTNGNGSLGNPNSYWDNVYANTINANEFIGNISWNNVEDKPTYTLNDFGVTATASELNYTDGVTSNIQTQLNSKAPLETPHLTGIPTAPNASAGDNSKQIATTAFVKTELSNHNSSNTAHSDIRELISTLTTRLNALADSDDTTLDQLSEIVAYIKSNRTLIENVTTNKVNVTDILDNLTSTATNKPLSAKQGKVLNDLINALSNVVDTKIDTINGDTYISTIKSGTTATITHKDVSRNNTASTVSPSHGGTFTAVKSVTSDSKGHVTGVDTEAVTLPKYSAGAGLELSGDTFLNTGVRSISTGITNGTISVDENGVTEDIPVKGLGSAAYTESSAYATASHTHDYLPLNGGGTIRDNDGDRITISPISIVGDTNSYIDGFSEIGASSFKEDGKELKDKYADKSHTHSKSEITDFPTTLPASDVYSWAKASNKPNYSWNEITDKPNSFAPYFANNTWYAIGDDVSIGDINVAGTLGIKGLNGTPNIRFFDPEGTFIGNVMHSGNYKTYCTPANIGSLSLSGGNMDKDSIVRFTSTDGISSGIQLSSDDGYSTSISPGEISTKNFREDGSLLSDKYQAKGNYAGSASSGGSANSAVKLDSSAGSTTQPVYFSSGKPVACTYTLGKSVPSDAVFTDTNTWRGIQDNLTSTSTTDSLSANQGKVLKDLIDSYAITSDYIDGWEISRNSTAIDLNYDAMNHYCIKFANGIMLLAMNTVIYNDGYLRTYVYLPESFVNDRYTVVLNNHATSPSNNAVRVMYQTRYSVEITREANGELIADTDYAEGFDFMSILCIGRWK